MVKRQLLYKEWKQSELTFILVMIIAALATPFTFLMEYSSFQSCLNDTTCTPAGDHFYYSFYVDTFLNSSWIIGLFFALMQLGIERNKGLMDFTLSLPFSRSSIYHSKFMLATGILILIHVVSYGLSFLLTVLLHPSEINSFHYDYLFALIQALMVYSLVLAAGALTGSAIAQAIVAFSTSILPILLIGLPVVHLDFFLQTYSIYYILEGFIMAISPIVYLEFGPNVTEPHLFAGEDIIIPILMIVLFYIIGLISFKKHPIERTGHFFLYPKMNRPIQIMVIAFGVLGFGMTGMPTENSSLFSYIVFMLIGGAVGALLSYILIYRKK
ncbi:ABC transporter ATP-binding protein [Bacillus sp. 179-C3.3 HS]|uniref:ABC transporter ATP-binding protein n=1 Tax=Bacillus sp. 179-C3.3 HS TaxID=3232162 RepID=UPI00399F3190